MGEPEKGDDVTVEVHVSLREAVLGTNLVLDLEDAPCTGCWGLGDAAPGETCPACDGAGSTGQPGTVQLPLPPGPVSDKDFPVQNWGKPGRNGGPRGYLRVIVHVEPVPDPGPRGDDVHVDLYLSPDDVGEWILVPFDLTLDRPCRTCFALGRTSDGKCATCGGRGVTSGMERVHFPFAKWKPDDLERRITNAGHAGPRGGPHGDIVFTARVEPDSVPRPPGQQPSMPFPQPVPRPPPPGWLPKRPAI